MVVVRLSTVCSHSAAPRQKQNNSCVRSYTCLQTATGGAALPSGGGDSQVQIKSPWVNFSRAALPRAAKLALMPSLEAPKSSRVPGLFPGLEAHAEIGPGSNCLSIWKPTLAG